MSHSSKPTIENIEIKNIYRASYLRLTIRRGSLCLAFQLRGADGQPRISPRHVLPSKNTWVNCK